MNNDELSIFHRSELLLGQTVMMHLKALRVIIFGVGGVGSWCAESLVRNGVGHLTLVDSDKVCATNCNRQLMATTKTIGQVKVEALRNRLLDINPDADIMTRAEIYNADTADSFRIGDYDYVIDAIDSLADKAHLILYTTQIGKENGRTMLFSSMGAALRMNPLMVRATEFWNVKGDALAKALRQRFKKQKDFPSRKFTCVYSEEVPMKNMGETDEQLNPAFGKVHVNGSLSQVTMVFGAALAGLVVQSVRNKVENE